MDILSSALGPLVPGTGGPEELIRTLLEVLGTLSELDSVYVTRFDEHASTLEVTLARNSPHRSHAIVIPEGLTVPWRDTLCRRAIKDSLHFTEYADEFWSDAGAVRHLGVRTFLSEPMRSGAGELMGTLCGISGRRVTLAGSTLHVFGVFARLIAHQLAQQDQLARLRHDNETLQASVLLDPLTGIANRRGLLAELERRLAQAARGPERVVVVFIDLDRFKAINDRYGHQLGDLFLVALAGRLVTGSRAGELVARYGGDEFVVVASFADGTGDEARLARRFQAVTRGRFRLGEQELDYAGASVGTAVAGPGEGAEALLDRADQAMYAVKERLYERQAEDASARH